MRFSLSFKFLFYNRRWVKYRFSEPLDYYRRLVPTMLVPMIAATVVGLALWLALSQRPAGGDSQRQPAAPQSPGWTLIIPHPKAQATPATMSPADISGEVLPSPAVPALSHQNIITTIFWVGEAADQSNDYIANSESAWDGQWLKHYGGVDNPTNRNGYFPAGFTPLENPFYVALPYDDLTDSGNRKASATSCPNSGNPDLANYSWCKNSWVKISHGGKIVYAQWEDVGPFQEDDTAYVFGSSPPSNQVGAKAGLDVSPAVRDYLGLQDVDVCDWAFVQPKAVSKGPWAQIITTSKGYSID